MTKMPTHDPGTTWVVDSEAWKIFTGGSVRCAGSISPFRFPENSISSVYHFFVPFTCGFVVTGQLGPVYSILSVSKYMVFGI
jgi:hypothetical protein